MLASLACVAAFLGGNAVHIARRSSRPAQPHRNGSPRLLQDDAAFSMGALRQEIERRGVENGTKLEFQPGLGRFEKMQRDGPHHTTTPKEVVEYVLTKLQEGQLAEAFTFSCIPVTKRGCHKSSTDWTRRMAWGRSRVIGGAPSGKALPRDEWDAMVLDTYAPLTKTQGYRFLGDTSDWQQKNGEAEMTAVKEYVVELKTTGGEHLLVKWKLVYDWLLYCHLVATVELFAMTSSAFPGSEDINLDI